MRQDVRHAQVRPPVRLIKVKPVLLEPRQINDAKIGAARRIKRGRLAQVIPARPNELAANKRIPVLRGELLVRRLSPAREIEIVGTHLPIRRVFPSARAGDGANAGGHREGIDPPAADGGFGLAAIDKIGREVLMKSRILALLVALPFPAP